MGCGRVAPATASAHHLDHSAVSSELPPPPPGFQAGGPGASWELVGTVATGNPQTWGATGDFNLGTAGRNAIDV